MYDASICETQCPGSSTAHRGSSMPGGQMLTVLADRRPALCAARRHEQDRLALHQTARSAVCGCIRCGDEDRGQELDYLIRLSLARIGQLTDRILEGNST